ncbi:MAG: hypothetical protein QXH37_01420 [Candidatus Bathyarchaeia archaeon]
MAVNRSASHVDHSSKGLEGAIVANGEFCQDVLRLRDEFLDLCAHIAARLSSGRVSEKAVASLLMESLCERFVVEKLKFEGADANEADRIWRNMHDYAVSLLLERLKNELFTRGFSVAVFNEVENPVGRYDVLLVVNRGRVQILNGNGSISLEVKTGLNVSLSQLEKYLWNGVTVILLRFATGDVVVLKPIEWADFLKSALADRIEIAKRILDNTPILVPGKDCRDCPLQSCPFNRKEGGNPGITKPKDLSELFNRFRENAYKAIESAVKAVITELTMHMEHEDHIAGNNNAHGGEC